MGLSLLLVAGWILFRRDAAGLSGQITGERLAELDLPPVETSIPATASKPDVEVVLAALEGDGLPLRSEYIAVRLTRADDGLKVTVEPGPRADPVRVALSERPGVRSVLGRERDHILEIRNRDLEAATADLVRDYATWLDGGPAMTRLPEYRDKVALNASVGAVGYAVEAIVSGHPFPCVYEDDRGNCYFFPPTGTKSFLVRGRTFADGSTPLPVEFHVSVRDVEHSSATADEGLGASSSPAGEQ